MIVSQTAEYALRAVIYLAHRQGEPQTTGQIAERTLVPKSYLPKVLQPLARCGILSAQRGSHGGYTLEIEANDLTVLRVISCVEPFKRIEHCPLRDVNHAKELCGLHQLLDEAVAATENCFAHVTIEHLLHHPDGLPALCAVGDHHTGTTTVDTVVGGEPATRQSLS